MVQHHAAGLKFSLNRVAGSAREWRNEPHLVKKKALAAMLSVSVRTIDGWIAKRVIPFLAPSPRLHLFDPEAVKKVIAAKFGLNATEHSLEQSDKSLGTKMKLEPLQVMPERENSGSVASNVGSLEQHRGKRKKRSVLTFGREGAEVRIYTLRAKTGYESYQCAWYEGGSRRAKTFGRLSAAKLCAQQKSVALANDMLEITQVTLHDVEVFKACEIRVRRIGSAVPAAIEEWLWAREALGSISLAEVVRFYQQHHVGFVPMTVEETVLLFLEAKKATQVSEVYFKSLSSQMRHFRSQFGSMQMAEVTTPEINRFLQIQTCSSVAKNNIRRYIVTLFNWAREQGYLFEDRKTAPERAMTFIVPDQAPAIWTPDEMRKLLKVCMPNLLPLVVIGAFSGIRSAEIDRLDWQDVLWDQGYIEIKAKKAKTKSRRLVPLRENLKKWLEPYRKDSGPVCHLSNSHLRLNYLGQKAGIGWRQNALRHSYASYRLAENQDAAKTALELGNSPEKLFRHYRELVTPEAATDWFSIVPDAR